MPVTKTPARIRGRRLTQRHQKTRQSADLERLASHCGQNWRRNLNADSSTGKGKKASAWSAASQVHPAEGEGKQHLPRAHSMLKSANHPGKTFNQGCRPAHIRSRRWNVAPFRQKPADRGVKGQVEDLVPRIRFGWEVLLRRRGSRRLQRTRRVNTGAREVRRLEV